MLNDGDAVLVTTEHRGVFYGRFVRWCDDDHKHISLRGARNCIFWCSEVRGFLGLAATGPLEGCKIGPAVDIEELRDVTCVARCTDQSVKAWEAWQ